MYNPIYLKVCLSFHTEIGCSDMVQEVIAKLLFSLKK